MSVQLVSIRNCATEAPRAEKSNRLLAGVRGRIDRGNEGFCSLVDKRGADRKEPYLGIGGVQGDLMATITVQ